MGLVKDEWIEAQERGWTSLDTHVCERCVDDGYLKDLVRACPSSCRCDYCGKSAAETVAACADVVLDAIFRAIGAYYCDPTVAGVPYDQGFIIEPIDIRDVLCNLGFDGHPDFVEAVIASEANGNAYVPAARGHWASSHDHEIMRYGWDAFAHVVKHETRFHFSFVSSSSNGSEREIGIREMLPTLGERLRPLVKRLPAETTVYRARVRKPGQRWEPTSAEMGAPPPECTTAGRMNPAGIPYLYTSFDIETAAAEVGVGQNPGATNFGASFILTRDIETIDLTQLRETPSVFDTDSKEAREASLFLSHFVNAISAPVIKDGLERVDYVPSQVVCEYFAQVFKPGRRRRLAGLIFPSSVRHEGKNLVVFPSVEDFERTFNGVKFVEAEELAP